MGRPRLYSDEQRREKRRIKQQRWRGKNLERAREIGREAEKRRAAKQALAAGRIPGLIGRPKQLTTEERRAKRNELTKRSYRANLAKRRACAAAKERQKRAAIKNGAYVAKPWGGQRLTESERKLRSRTDFAKRRALLRQNGGAYGPEDVVRLLNRQKGKCAFCLTPLADDYHIDHHIPLALGGSNDISNLRLLHPKCNLIKGAKHPIDHALSQGMLCW
jgi:5-methylcytosine-specific restriction endonuclease McrA